MADSFASASVAGVYTPAFVERRESSTAGRCGRKVSLGFIPQPLLSDHAPPRPVHRDPGVAGVYTPAFVERLQFLLTNPAYMPVSLGFIPQPLLSEVLHLELIPDVRDVSLGFIPQPLLSVLCHLPLIRKVGCVAGVYTPAFVERELTAG